MGLPLPVLLSLLTGAGQGPFSDGVGTTLIYLPALHSAYCFCFIAITADTVASFNKCRCRKLVAREGNSVHTEESPGHAGEPYSLLISRWIGSLQDGVLIGLAHRGIEGVEWSSFCNICYFCSVALAV